MGRKEGVTDDQLRAMDCFEASCAFTPLEKLVLEFAVAMTKSPVEVSDDLFGRLQEHLNHRELVELTSAIAWENYRARFAHAFGLEADGFSAGSYCPLPQGALPLATAK